MRGEAFLSSLPLALCYVVTYGSGIGPVFWPVADRTVSSRNFSIESSIPIESWVRVKVPLMPEVALVELPPKKGFLSNKVTWTPPSINVCAADNPERPPPTTIADGIVFELRWLVLGGGLQGVKERKRRGVVSVNTKNSGDGVR